MSYTTTEQRTLADLSKRLTQAPSPMFREDAAQQITDLQQVIRYHE